MSAILVDFMGTVVSFLPPAVLCYISFDKEKYKYSTAKTLIIIFSFIIVAAAVLAYCVSRVSVKNSTNMSLIANLSFIGLSVVCFALFDYLLRGDSVKKLIVYLLAMNYGSVLFFAYSIVYYLTEKTPAQIQGIYNARELLIQCIISAALFPLMYWVFLKVKKYISVIDGNTNRKLLISVIFVIILYMFSFSMVDSSKFVQANFIALFLAFTFCIVMLYVMLFLICYLNKVDSMHMLERQQAVSNLSMQSALYDNTLQNINTSKKIRHDVKHHLAALQGIVGSDEIDDSEKLVQIKNYLSEYGEYLKTEQDVLYCGDAALNSLLNYYISKAKSRGIKVNCGVSLPDNIGIKDTHLCIIAGNLLLNAIEAAEEVPEGKRIIKVRMMTYNDNLLIAVDNTYNNEIKEKNGRFATTKENGSGLGIECIKNIACIYNGCCSFEYDESEFRASVRLNIENK